MGFQELEDIFSFSEEFREKKENLPYHVNIIDELHINENGHSRILTKLLQYKNKKKEYVILRSLLKYIAKKKIEFNKIEIEKPTITQEERRIDLWVRDEKYALIFENKIYDATDQEAQICRYIEKTKENEIRKYEDDKIYVIYLSRSGNEPAPQTWGGYKEDFKSRYVNLSFRDDILPWLKNSIAPKKEEECLRSAIYQYVDFLEGEKMFRTSSIYKNMKKELENLIQEKVTLNCKTKKERYDKLTQSISNFNEVVEQMTEIKKDIKLSYLKEQAKKWRTKIKREEKYQQLKLYEYKENPYYKEIRLCVSREYEPKDLRLYIGYNERKGDVFCQLEFSSNIPNNLKERFKKILPDLKGSTYCEKNKFDDEDIDAVFNCFEEALEELVKLK